MNVSNKGIAKAAKLAEFENLDPFSIAEMKISEAKKAMVTIIENESKNEGRIEAIIEVARNFKNNGADIEIIIKQPDCPKSRSRNYKSVEIQVPIELCPICKQKTIINGPFGFLTFMVQSLVRRSPHNITNFIKNKFFSLRGLQNQKMHWPFTQLIPKNMYLATFKVFNKSK